MPPALIKIGIITEAHGIRGQVKIYSLTDPQDDFFSFPSVTDVTGNRTFAFARQGVFAHGFIASIEGVTTRNEAELLKNIALYTASTDLPEKNDGEWYYRELTGLRAQLPDGKEYGCVSGVYNFGAGDIIEIELPGGHSEMLPFNDVFVPHIHHEQGFLVIIPPFYIEE